MQDSIALRQTDVLTLPLWPLFLTLMIGLAIGAVLGWWWRGRGPKS
jgi:hypothetical protein